MSNQWLIAGGVIALITVGGLWLHLDAVSAERDAAQHAQAVEHAESLRRQRVIDTLNHSLEQLNEQQQANGRELAELRAAASQATQTAEDLQRENRAIREWANARLPDELARLYQHGPLTGTAGYRDYLRDTRAVRTARRTPQGQR